MLPNITIFGIHIDWFNLNLIIATIICAFFVYYYIKYRTKTVFSVKLIISFGLLAAFLGLLGARLLSVAEIYLLSNGEDLPFSLQEYLLYHGGYSFYGGMILNLIVLLGITHFVKSIKFPAFDILAMNCCLAYALGRIGCQLSGDGCYGIATNLPWGMYYPYGPAPNILPVHPTPIYETVANLILFFFLLRLDKNKKFMGQTASVFLIGFATLRFLVEMIRVNDPIVFGLTSAQLIAIFLFGLGVVSYYIGAKQVSSNTNISASLSQTAI